jgi:hypothetical protein
MFSHTTKGQSYNMESLSRFLRPIGRQIDEEGGLGRGLEPRLIDYELLVGEDGKRSVGFGWFAGGGFRFFFCPRCFAIVWFGMRFAQSLSSLISSSSCRRVGIILGYGTCPPRNWGS